jgi:Protein of unknown function (DUF1190)
MRKASKQLKLVLVGTLAGASLGGAMTGCTDTVPTPPPEPQASLETASRDVYRSADDCQADWGAEADKCQVVPASDFDPEGMDKAQGIAPNPDGSLGYAGDGGSSSTRSSFFYGPLYYGQRTNYVGSNRAVASMHGNGNKSIYQSLGMGLLASRAGNGVVPSMRQSLASPSATRTQSASIARSPATASRGGFGSSASRSSSGG